MKITRILIAICIGVFLYSLMNSCAQMGTISGGERDTIPPVVILTDPLNRSAMFDDKVIMMEFDEFLNTRSISQELLVSPPIEEKFQILSKGKKLLLKIKDTLREDITYTLKFRNSIQDLNENNPLENYQFVFSTGPEVDSLKIIGKLLDAKTHMPVEDIFVFAYFNHADSVPLLEKPDYLTTTDTAGVFSIDNIKKVPYKLFALKDGNMNLIFDVPTEQIAFSDSIYTPDISLEEYMDTISVDPTDSLANDSVIVKQNIVYSPDTVLMYLFTERSKNQFVSTSERPDSLFCIFAFNLPLEEHDSIQLIEPDSCNVIFEQQGNNDSILVWLADSLGYSTDTLSFALTYDKLDSAENVFRQKDTLQLVYKPKKEEKKDVKPPKQGQRNSRLKPKKDEEEEAPEDSLPEPKWLDIEFSFQGGDKINSEQKIWFQSKHPVSQIDTGKISIYHVENDSVQTPVKFEIMTDTSNIRNFFLSYQLEQEKKYQVIFLEEAVYDIFQLKNDSLSASFTVESDDIYGSVKFFFTDSTHQFILQQLSDKNEIENEYYLPKGCINYEVKFLLPNEYRFALIYDANGNKIWDTGNYLQHKQAEKIEYFYEIITVKEGFKNELHWKSDLKNDF